MLGKIFGTRNPGFRIAQGFGDLGGIIADG
jgi:hypothetical protein